MNNSEIIKETTPLISVVIPTYNRVEHLMRAVKSVYNQSYENIEIIVIDDNLDNSISATICSKLKKDFSTIQYIKNEKNFGAAKSRNIGIEHSKGAFVSFLDDDDYWLPEKINTQVEYINNSKEVVKCLDSGFFEVNEDNNSKLVIEPDLQGDIFENLLVKEGYRAPKLSTFVCSKNLLQEIGGFDERLKARQDLDLYLRLALKSKFYSVTTPLAVKCIHDDGRISNDKSGKIEAYEILYEKYKRHYIGDPGKNFKYKTNYNKLLFKNNNYFSFLKMSIYLSCNYPLRTVNELRNILGRKMKF